MKKENTASIFVSRKDVSSLLLLLTFFLPLQAINLQNYRINHIYMLSQEKQNPEDWTMYGPLIHLSAGDLFNTQRIKKSLENLYKTDDFSNIETKVERITEKTLDLYFILQKKARIHSLSFQPDRNERIKNKEMANAVYSLRKGDTYEEYNLEKASEELQNYLKSRGYFNAQIKPRVIHERGPEMDVAFLIALGKPAVIRSLAIEIDDPQMKGIVTSHLRGESIFVPARFEKKKEAITAELKRYRYYFPEIKTEENFLATDSSLLDMKVIVSCGFKYYFRFMGLPNKMSLIRSTWEKKIFEKYAEEESRARLLNFLKNDGYLDAEIKTNILVRNRNKYVIFSALKSRRYSLGHIYFQGNQSLSGDELLRIIKTDEQIFNRIFWLKASSLQADIELIRLQYASLGFPNAQINLDFKFVQARADAYFIINEKERYRIQAIEFSGNRFFTSQLLLSLLKTKPASPFIQKQLNGDIENLQNFYMSNGFSDALVVFELTPGEDKNLRIRIHEGDRKLTGKLMIIGGSKSQKRLISKFFPLKPGQPYDQEKIANFKAEIDSSSIYNEVRVEPIGKSTEVNDVLIKVVADQGRFYGFGLGWEERKGLRGTFEYHEKNIFRSISSLSTMLQIGLNERRGIVAYDTPFFLNTRINSSFSLWEENEIFPSYRFTRGGIGASFSKHIFEKLYFVGSLKWYRTILTELLIPPFSVDQLDKPFDTTAFSLSFVRENRDDPFNPTTGDFLSADLKIGLPVFEKNYTFLKVFWNYQKHVPILKNGVLSFSFRNGFGFGDMSITERFFAGGSHSFRGTRNDRLGPIDPDTNQPAGGNILVLANLEATFPSLLVPVENLYYSVFADIGNVFPKASDLNFAKMERALGVSLKYRTPIGPLRLDFSWNLRKAAEQNFLIFLGIGNVY